MSKKVTKKNINVKKKTVSTKKKNDSKLATDNKVLFGVIAFLGLVIFALLLGGSYEEKWVQKGEVKEMKNI